MEAIRFAFENCHLGSKVEDATWVGVGGGKPATRASVFGHFLQEPSTSSQVTGLLRGMFPELLWRAITISPVFIFRLHEKAERKYRRWTGKLGDVAVQVSFLLWVNF